jgi:DNA mismatch repair protein MutS2
MKNALNALEVNKIKDELLTYASTEKGKEMIRDLEPITDFDTLKNTLDALNEVFSFYIKYSSPSLSNSKNLDAILNIVRKDGVLTVEDIDKVLNDINITNKIKEFMGDKVNNFPYLKEITSSFKSVKNLETTIKKIVAPNLTIYDNASPELKKIRRDIHLTEEKIKKTTLTMLEKYGDKVTSNTVTLRNGHYVIPVKLIDKYNVKGIIHDISSSGQTVFIEPSELVELNNNLLSLLNEEQMEIKRLLAFLSKEIALNEDELRTNNDLIGELDFLFAKARYGNDMDAYVANLVHDPVVFLKNARHPLIPKDQVVANTFEFPLDKRLIIISGPNAGGKTVVLKTIGLLVLMNQMGLMIPVSETPTLGFFRDVHVDIGDNQSLSDNLSTFSAHMANIVSILNNVEKDDLVLLDELGTGTNPREGEALALGILEELRKVGALSIVSSHFELVKMYAANESNAFNSSMIFNLETLTPTYVYLLGVPGQSYALEVAKRYGINDEIIEYAKNVLSDNSHLSLDKLISDLQKSREENVKLNEDLVTLKSELETELKKQKDLNEKLNDERNKVKVNANKLVEKEINRVNKELDALLKLAYEGNLKPHEIIELKGKLPSVNLETEEIEIPFDPKVNDYAKSKTLGVSGKITKINDNKVELLLDNGRKIATVVSDLVKAEKPKEKKVTSTKRPVLISENDSHYTYELNVIGYRVLEATEEISKFLDNALLKNYPSVRIIHGYGSGALRKGIHAYLKTVPFVKDFYLEPKGTKTSSVTIVELK